MNNLYPLTFEPLYKDYIWGGRNLEKLGKTLPDTIVAESWEISAHHDGMNIVGSGLFQGRTLISLVEELGEHLLGSLNISQYQNKFPLLLKLIDANEWLSVQVHPDDTYALSQENDLGKTEMWYIIEAQPGAHILYGFTRSITRGEFEKIQAEGRISHLLRSVPVKAGDVIYIPAGTVHAAGKGMLIAEVQQNSNATYRLYDYDRKNADGTSRPLHIAKALDSIDFENSLRDGRCSGLSYEKDGLVIRVIIADSHFCSEVVDVNKKASLSTDGRSFMAYTFLNGSGILTWANGSMPVKSGDSVLIPAGLGSYTMEGSIKALRAYIGDRDIDIIRPLMAAGYSKELVYSKLGGLG